MFGIFKKKDDVVPEQNDEEFGGIGEALVDRVLAAFGINKEQIDKVKTIIDMIEVNESDDHVELVINIKSVTVKIDK